MDSRRDDRPYPEPDAADARRAVIDAARFDGTTCERGAYKARRTVMEPEPNARPGDIAQVVVLDYRWPTHEPLAWFRVTPFDQLRDDWSRPSPVDPGDSVLPADQYDVDDVFVAPEVLPGVRDDRPGDRPVDVVVRQLVEGAKERVADDLDAADQSGAERLAAEISYALDFPDDTDDTDD